MQQEMDVKFNIVTHVIGKSPACLKHYNSPPSPKLSILKIHSIQAYYKEKIGLIFITRLQMLFKGPRRESVLADQKLKGYVLFAISTTGNGIPERNLNDKSIH